MSKPRSKEYMRPNERDTDMHRCAFAQLKNDEVRSTTCTEMTLENEDAQCERTSRGHGMVIQGGAGTELSTLREYAEVMVREKLISESVRIMEPLV